ncbi:MAG: hypothetical protein IBX57_00695 [Gammaproteobacteria bacterium]|nr:hypothetical protein [Gammaproteobacteria bacterium]
MSNKNFYEVSKEITQWLSSSQVDVDTVNEITEKGHTRGVYMISFKDAGQLKELTIPTGPISTQGMHLEIKDGQLVVKSSKNDIWTLAFFFFLSVAIKKHADVFGDVRSLDFGEKIADFLDKVTNSNDNITNEQLNEFKQALKSVMGKYRLLKP